MHILKMFITAVCFIFLIKLRWPKTKSLCYSEILFITNNEAPFDGMEWERDRYEYPNVWPKHTLVAKINDFQPDILLYFI